MLSQQNANVPKGQIWDGNTTADILANDQLLKADYYKPLIVGYHNGAAIKLSDIADVQDSVENIRAAGFFNGKPCVMMQHLPAAQRQYHRHDLPDPSGASVVESLDSRGDQRESSSFDRATSILPSVRDAERSLLVSIGLVILVVFVFLRSPRATLIPSVAVPVSLLGTFGVMYLFGYSIDNISLMALTICTGFVVDDAIVVIENITPACRAGNAPPGSRLARSAGNRLHRSFHDDVAGGRIHSDPVDGRHRGPPVPRVCRHTFRVDSGFFARFPDDDADDVLPPFEAGTWAGARANLSHQ